MNRIRGWALWSARTRSIAYFLAVDALVLTVFTGSLADGVSVSSAQWSQFAVLLLGAHVYQVLSRRPEDRRRSEAGSHGLHADLTSAFAFPAAVLLPLPLATALIISVRLARYGVARRPPHRFTFTTASILLAGYSAHTLLTLTGEQHLHHTHLEEQLLLAAIGAWYCAQQMLLVAVAFLLDGTGRHLPRRAVVGDAEHLAIVAAGIGMGVLVTVSGADLLSTALVVLLAVVTTSLVGHRDRGRRDSGTGLATKGRWNDLATARLREAVRDERPVAVLVIDLDHFKDVNDRCGHLVGDEFLAEVATVLTTNVRAGHDVVGRFGGEEFVVLLPDRDTTDALTVAERIRTQIPAIALPYEHPAGGAPAVLTARTASIGAATAHPTAGATLDLTVLLGHADAAVYRAKHSGRDRVVLARLPDDSTTARTT